MDPNKKPEEPAAATLETDKGKMAASSAEEPAPTSDMNISEESEEKPAPTSEMEPASSEKEESSEEETADAAEAEARLIAEAVFQEKVAELAAIRMEARNLVEEFQIGSKVLKELRDKMLREDKVTLSRPPLKDDQDGNDKDKDK